MLIDRFVFCALNDQKGVSWKNTKGDNLNKPKQKVTVIAVGARHTFHCLAQIKKKSIVQDILSY